MPSTVAYYNVDSRGEKTSQETGKQDLFSSVAEQNARSNSKKWDEEQKMKEENARAAAEQASRDAAAQGQEQAAAGLTALIGELNALAYQDDTTQEKISQGRTMLEMLDGTEQYEALKQQFDEAAARAGSLPYEEQTVPPSQEIGPGITHEARPGEAPSASQDITSGQAPGVQPGAAPGGIEAVGPGGL